MAKADSRAASVDGGVPFGFEIVDHAGRSQTRDAAPRAARFFLRTVRALDADSGPVMLLQGELDEALEDDLTRAPLLAAHATRVVPSTIDIADDLVSVTPMKPLCAGCTFTLAVAGFARFEDGGYVSEDRTPTGFTFRVSSDTRAGASVIASLPASGASGVPLNLRFAALVLDGNVRGFDEGVWLEAEDRTSVPVAVSTVPCAELDARGATCIELVPLQPLRPLARYSLRTGAALRDAHGTVLEAYVASFSTGDTADARRPAPQLLACAADEVPLPIGCATIDDTHFELHIAGDDIARVVLDTGNHDARLATRGDIHLQQGGLQPGERVTGTLTAFDLANNSTRTSFALTTESDLPKLSITEVRPDPRGPEPDQEIVELWNYGDTSIALAGFVLTDAVDEPGEPLVTSTVLYPGARALLVADGFDPDNPLDGPIPPGALLVRVGKALGKSGLTNAGEPLFLRDPAGRRVSAAPATKSPRAGACLQRISTDMRSGAASSFSYDSDADCTPGE